MRSCLSAAVLAGLFQLAGSPAAPLNPFRPAAQMRILGAMQRPWELRPFYATSVGAGSFVPLVSPWVGAAMASQHPAAPGGTDGMHPAADDGLPGGFRPLLVAIWDHTKSPQNEESAAAQRAESGKAVPIALLSGGISMYELGTQCSTLHGPECPELKRIARTRDVAVMLATIALEPTVQWWSGAYHLDRGVQTLVGQMSAWRRVYESSGLSTDKQRTVAEVALTLRAKAGGANAVASNAAAAAKAAEERTQQARARVAAAQAAGDDAPEFVPIGRGYCRAPNDGKTHYTYRCFPLCRGKDQMDLKACEGLCTSNCTAISHRKLSKHSPSRCDYQELPENL